MSQFRKLMLAVFVSGALAGLVLFALQHFTVVPLIQAAEAYVQTQSDVAGSSFQFLGPDLTWRPAATLHVLRATPSTAASYGGDYYFFFVNGNPVSRQYFTGAMSEQGLDDTTFSVTYRVYHPGDPHCCPTGGTATVRFRWNGSAVVALDPMPGATQS